MIAPGRFCSGRAIGGPYDGKTLSSGYGPVLNIPEPWHATMRGGRWLNGPVRILTYLYDRHRQVWIYDRHRMEQA